MSTKKIASLSIYSNGGLGAFDETGQQMGDVQSINAFALIFEKLESMGYNPAEIPNIWTSVNGNDKYIRPIKQDDGSWNYTFSAF